MKKSFYFFCILFVFTFFQIADVKAEIKTEKIYAGSGDGSIQTTYNPNMGEGIDWGSIRNEELNVFVGDELIGNTGVGIGATLENEDKWSTLVRSIFPFDTSAIPEEAIITSAKIHIFTLYKINNGLYSHFDWNVYKADPKYSDKLVAEDFLAVGSLPFSTAISFDDTASNDGDNIFELNNDGIGSINKNGFTSFGIRSEYYDVLNNEPEWASYTSAVVKIFFSEHSDITKRPYLEITYELPEETLDPIILIPGILGSWKVDGELVLDPMLNTYSNLWDALELAGYKENKTLFAFPYDWRESNVDTAERLAWKVDVAKLISGSDKVDIVAHSMGGLVAREYLSQASSTDNVDQLIFLATPHRGATEAYLSWEGGEFGDGFSGFAKKRIFKQEARESGYKSIYDYIRGEEIYSVRELLPVYDYLKKNGTLFAYPNNHPNNIFLDRLNQVDELAVLENIDVLNLVGVDGSDTMDYINIKRKCKKGTWGYGCPKSFEMGLGDGTVPNRSNYTDFDFSTFSLEASHNWIVSEAQEMVIEALTGEKPTDTVWTSKKNKSMIFVQVFSPVDMQVENSAGEMSGKDFVAMSNEMEIEESYYTGFEAQSEFVSMRNSVSDTYTIRLLGMESGEYTLVVSYFDVLGREHEESFTGNIQIGEMKEFTFSFDDGTPEIVDLQIIGEANPFDVFKKDLLEFEEAGSLKKNSYKQLLRRIVQIEKQYNKVSDNDCGWRNKFNIRNVRWQIKILEYRLKNMRRRGWISSEAYNILIKDLKNIGNML